MTGGPIEAWSPSAHRSAIACPRQFWLQYVHRAKGTDSPASVRGQVMHAGMAAGWLADAMERAEEGFDLHAAVIRQMEWEAKRHDVADDDLDEWIETVLTALERLAPQPGDVLLGTEVDLSTEHDGVTVKARLDLVFLRGNVLRVWDWKSSRELPRRRDVERDTQLGVGALLAARHFGHGRVIVGIASIGAGVAVEAGIIRETARAAAQRIADTARRYESETEFAPRRGEACAGCKVRALCPIFADGPVPEPAEEVAAP